MTNGLAAKAAVIAREDLLACTTSIGLAAGAHHFVDLWARDSLFATFGLSAKIDFPIVKTTIKTFFDYQRDDGFIPYRISRSSADIAKYFGKPHYLSVPKADFHSHQSGGLVLDGGLMTIIAAFEYARRSGDTQFLKKYKKKLTSTIKWYEVRFEKDLLREWFQCEWADSVLKIGNTLYTNILYWRALGDIGENAQQKSIGKKINEKFWTGTYFADWIDYKRQDFFAAYPNMLAIIFGLATKRQAEEILAYAASTCWNGWTLEENYPTYPWWRIPITNYLIGMADYHNRGCIWLQPGILYAMALKKAGHARDARNVLEGIAEKIVEYNGVYEVYEQDGAPVKRLLYRAEQPFAWSAGFYLWASEQIMSG